jgi:hypothetical protein
MAPGSAHTSISFSTAHYKKFHGMITVFPAAEHKYSKLHLKFPAKLKKSPKQGYTRQSFRKERVIWNTFSASLLAKLSGAECFIIFHQEQRFTIILISIFILL